MFSRDGLEVDTTITTVYFVQNSDNNYELQSTATGNVLPIVKRANGEDMPSGCSVSGLEVMTESGWIEIDDNGFSLTTSNEKSYVEV